MTLGINEVTGVVASLVCAWGAVGLMPHLLRPSKRAAFWLSATVILLLVQGAGRTLYWDGMALAFGDDRTVEIREAFGGIGVNWFWNAVLFAAGLSMLRLLHLLIPEDERHRWSILSAPTYPVKVTADALVDLLRRLRRRP